jgi:hypothetical protein
MIPSAKFLVGGLFFGSFTQRRRGAEERIRVWYKNYGGFICKQK